MFEVLVALVMSFLFLTGTLNAIVVATIVQVQAERKSQASFWIQEDLDTVMATASAENYTSEAGCPGAVGADFVSNGLPALATTSDANRELVNVNHRLVRTTSTNQNTVGITYEVYEDYDENGTTNGVDATDPIVELYAEVLPEVALQCD